MTKANKSYNITAGVSQGFIPGPVLWNAAYDGVLRVNLPPGVKLVVNNRKSGTAGSGHHRRMHDQLKQWGS